LLANLFGFAPQPFLLKFIFPHTILFLNSQMVRRRMREIWVKFGVGFSGAGGAGGSVIRDSAGGGIIPLGK
jgi:hypothetical protein